MIKCTANKFVISSIAYFVFIVVFKQFHQNHDKIPLCVSKVCGRGGGIYMYNFEVSEA